MSDAILHRFDLADLASPQQRAGLAGLCLQVMHFAHLPDPPGAGPWLCRLDDLDARGVTLVADRAGIDRLMSAFYAADEVAVEVKAGAGEDGEDEEVDESDEGEAAPAAGGRKKAKTKTVMTVRPRNDLVETLGGGVDGLWTQLWRYGLWRFYRRSGPARNVFKYRLKDPLHPADEEWELLRAPTKAAPLAGSILLGGEAKSSENTILRDRADRVFLLRFAALVVAWSGVLGPSAPHEDRWRVASYAAAFPDVDDLARYVREVVPWMALRPQEPHPVYQRLPKSAVVAAAAEAGIDCCREGVAGIWVYDVQRQGNRMVTLGVEQVGPVADDGGLLAGLSHPLTRAAAARAVASGEDLDAVLARYVDAAMAGAPPAQTIDSPGFRRDVRVVGQRMGIIPPDPPAPPTDAAATAREPGDADEVDAAAATPSDPPAAPEADPPEATEIPGVDRPWDLDEWLRKQTKIYLLRVTAYAVGKDVSELRTEADRNRFWKNYNRQKRTAFIFVQGIPKAPSERRAALLEWVGKSFLKRGTRDQELAATRVREAIRADPDGILFTLRVLLSTNSR